MSFFRKAVRTIGRGVAAYYTAGASEAIRAARKAPAIAAMPASLVQGESFGGGIMQTMGAMPGAGAVLRSLPGAIGFGAGVAVRNVRAITRGAAALCMKHPQWCSTIGGVAAVAALMESGQLPIPKRRRGRGLTPRDLRSFRRVARLIRVFAPTVRRIPHRALHVRGTGITHA